MILYVSKGILSEKGSNLINLLTKLHEIQMSGIVNTQHTCIGTSVIVYNATILQAIGNFY